MLRELTTSPRRRPQDGPTAAAVGPPWIRRVALAALLWTLAVMEVATEPVDVALNKPVLAWVTCGKLGEESYYNHSTVLVGKDIPKGICYNETTHSPEHMVDGLAYTWWQSTSRTNLGFLGYGVLRQDPQAVIVVNLEQEFEVRQIRIQSADSKRPGFIVIYKSMDGVLFTPWIYRMSITDDCSSLFNIPTLSSPVTLDSVVCQAYATPMQMKNEIVVFDFITGVSTELAVWRNTRYVKIEFFDMDVTNGIKGVKFQHFTVRQLEVLAECSCSGQQVGCEKAETTGQYQCVCGGNTRGEFCQQCLPFYNQYHFQYGVSCAVCNCNAHATQCTYDEGVDELSMSINADGIKSGGGVCIECGHNTTGINCGECVSSFYRPAGRRQSSLVACIPCVCHVPGVTINPATGLLGDCVMNDDLPAANNMLPGDCFCKKNVEGSQCDRCKQHYFNLTASNPDGCQACECDLRGTELESNVCHPNGTGQCPCKKYVIGRQCEQCLDNFYGINVTLADGCVACDCDPGGSTSPLCNKASGQCTCKLHITGRKCDKTDTGYYLPDLHFLAGEFESLDNGLSREQSGYNGLGYFILTTRTEASTTVDLPAYDSIYDKYTLLLKYSSTFAVLAEVVAEDTARGSVMTMVELSACSPWCSVSVADMDLLPPTRLTVTVSITTDVELLLDRLVLLPYEFSNTSLVLKSSSESFDTNCDVINNDMSAAGCSVAKFSLMVSYLGGGLLCGCHPLGSDFSVPCEDDGGQCVCKPGVGGRKCDDCLLEYHSLSSSGCEACNCAAEQSVCDRKTGQCVCPLGATGVLCDRCMTNYWNWDASTGCRVCGCNAVGAIHPQCNLTSGLCDCRPGVGGPQCDFCLDGYHGFSNTGCASCGCSTSGSTSSICNTLSAQCLCKDNSEGQQCGTCKPYTFYLAEEHEYGCLDCVCMGVTTECSSSKLKRDITTAQLVDISESNDTLLLLSVVKEGQSFVDEALWVTVDGTQMVETEVLAPDPPTYWQLHSALLGNLLNLYQGHLAFTVQYETLSSLPTTRTSSLLMLGHDGVEYTFPLPPVPPNERTEISVLISETEVQSGAFSNRQQFMLALSNVQALLIPATWTNTAHLSRLIDVHYEIASGIGLGERALGVEQCACGLGYSGLSCENCAPGYKRLNASSHSYLGLCIPCECNGHAQYCHPDTGQCQDCLHQTTGFFCEVCEVGYYGDATSGLCSLCPCYTPRVVNSTCEALEEGPRCQFCEVGYAGNLCDQCDTFYFGDPEVRVDGRCSRCDCNGNTGDCDSVTGECLSCSHNSTGFYCERCQDGWYGNASAQICSECGCDQVGSVQDVCDHQTGQCECLPGVGDRICSTCIPNYYGLQNATFSGCVPCECNEAGSADAQCDDEGRCQCTLNTGGDKCDLCADHFFGLPHQPCESCRCDDTGTIDPSQPCERIFGDCKCKTGVTGRRCDQCERLYVDFSDTGCISCGRCQYGLGNDTGRLEDLWQTCWDIAMGVADIQQADLWLQDLTNQLTSTTDVLGLSGDQLNLLRTTVEVIMDSLPARSAQINPLASHVYEVLDLTSQQEVGSSEELERLEDLWKLAEAASTDARTLTLTSQQRISTLSTYNTTAVELLRMETVDTGNMNFDDEFEETEQQEQSAQQLSTRADQNSAAVLLQADRVNTLQEEALTEEAQLTEIRTELDDLNIKLADLKIIISATELTFNDTNLKRTLATTTISGVEQTLNLAQSMLDQTEQARVQANAAFNQALTLLIGPSDLLPPQADSLNGVNGWQSGAIQLDASLQSASTSLDTYANTVTVAEEVAAQLTQEALLLANEYATVQQKGQTAVDAIDNYNTVVEALSASLEMALQANQSMMATLAVLKNVSVEELATEAVQALDQAEVLKARASAQDGTATLTQVEVDVARQSLLNANTKWSVVDTELHELSVQVNDTTLFTPDDDILDNVAGSNEVADEAIAEVTILADRQQNLGALVDQQETDVNSIESTTISISQQQTLVQQQLNKFKETYYEELVPQVTRLEGDQENRNETLVGLEGRLASLESRLEMARLKLLRMRQPVNFDVRQYLVLDNPHPTSDLRFSQVSLKFTYKRQAQGVLFFVHNPSSGERLLVQILNKRVVFEWSDGRTTLTAQSPTFLCLGCWFYVQATRYENEGKLTVKKMSTGGLSVNYMYPGPDSQDISSHLMFTSPLYIGGVPENIQEPLVYPVTDFVGCLHDVRYNTYLVPLWDSLMYADSLAQCCAHPTSVYPDLPVIKDAVCVDGFGYLCLLWTSISVMQYSHVSLEMRMYSPAGVIMAVRKPGVSAFYSLQLLDGRLVFVVRSKDPPGRQYELITAQTYNDGNWYKVTVMHNSTYIQMHVEERNGTQLVTREVHSKDDLVNLDLAELEAGEFTFGGLSPNTSSSIELDGAGFAGCLQGLLHHVDESLDQVALPLLQDVVTSQGINTYNCYEQVLPGIAFLVEDSYAGLSSTTNILDEIEMNFQTYEANGVLAHGVLSSSPNHYIYVAVFHGDVILLFDQGNGQQPVLRIDGHYVADGQIHQLKVVFSYPNSPQLHLDDVVEFGAVTMRTDMRLDQGLLHVGGLDPSVSPGADVFPTLTSLRGGISDIYVNEEKLDYWSDLVLRPTRVRGVSLSGLPLPPDAEPPLPYTTTPAPPTPPQPTCTQPRTPVLAEEGYRFGDDPVSYMMLSLSDQLKASLKTAISFVIEFRALQPDGLLLYMADFSVSADNYMALFMHDGHLVFSCITDSGVSQTTDVTRLLTTEFRYDDAQWYQVQALRINDFMAIFVRDTKDYRNNQASSKFVSNITVNTNLYLGGVPPNILGFPFTSADDVPIGKKPFSGCIRLVKYETREADTTFSLNEGQTEGVGRCLASVTPGTLLQGDTSYARIEDPDTNTFLVNSLFSLSVVFRGSVRNGTLVTAWLSQSYFLIVDIFNGQIRLWLGNPIIPTNPYVEHLHEMPDFVVCDGLAHSFNLSLSPAGVSMWLDDLPEQDTQFQPGYSIPNPVPVYVGLPDVLLPADEWSGVSYTGCIMEVLIKQKRYSPLYAGETRAAKAGCLPG